MKKKYNILLVFICLFTFVASGIISLSNTIVTQKQNYLIEAPDNYAKVSTRELAMLASLAYEDVPNYYNYEMDADKINENIIDGYKVVKQTNSITKENTLVLKKSINGKDYTYGIINPSKDLSCINENGKLETGCFYSSGGTRNKGFLKYGDKVSKYPVLTYIEGMSQRKLNSIMSKVTDTFQEDGQTYYFLDFADVEELTKLGWEIFDYKTTRPKTADPDDVSWNYYFDAVTFKKGSNYVIAYRGTDFPDLYEWVEDLKYALNQGIVEEQALDAYNYAKDVYDKIVKDNSDANIYVTGHSLGAYLAQIGGAAIVDLEASRGPANIAEPVIVANSNEINKYTEEYKIKSANNNSIQPSRLKQVAYFNGMGVNGLLYTNRFSLNIDNALIYLSTHDENGNLIEENENSRYVNYSTSRPSSGRLVLYSMEGDPISNVGVHYGEIYRLEIAAGAIINHKGNHELNLSAILTDDGMEALLGNIGDTLINKIKMLIPNETRVEKIESLSKFVSTIISYPEKISDLIEEKNENIKGYKKYDNVPEFVSSVVKAETNTDIKNYHPISLLANFVNGPSTVKDKYFEDKKFLTSLVDIFNVAHETDSFACIPNYSVDKDDNIVTNGDLTTDKITLDFDTVNYTRGSTGNTVKLIDPANTAFSKAYMVSEHYNVEESPKLRKYARIVDVKDATGKSIGTKYYDYSGTIPNKPGYINYSFIYLKADLDNSCGRSYTWEYSLDGINWITFAENTYNNEVVFNAKNSNGHFVVNDLEYVSKEASIQFRVKVNYSNNFTEIKSKYKSGGFIDYSEGKKYSGNPTIENEYFVDSKAVYSDVMTVTFQKK